MEHKQEKHLNINEDNENNENSNKEDNNENLEEQEEEDLWFYCDNCKKPLKEGKIKYECKTCEDFTLCKKCFKSINHQHQMKKSLVPQGCNPPSNAEELIAQVEKGGESSLILRCTKCNKIIVESYYYVCNEDECKNIKFCLTCRGLGKQIHEHKLRKYILKEENDNSNNNVKTKKQKLEELIDLKANYNIDDVIDKNLGTKFHYAKVAKEDSGLTDEMLLLLDDKILNKYLPLKKIAAYGDYKLPEYKKKKMLYRLEK